MGMGLRKLCGKTSQSSCGKRSLALIPSMLFTWEEKGMAMVIAMYKTPKDTSAFDKYYFEKPVPLAKKIPGIGKYTEVIMVQ